MAFAVQESKLSLEEIDNIECRVAKLHESWDNRLILGAPKLLKRYMANKMNIQLQVRSRSIEGHRTDYCAILTYRKKFRPSPHDLRQLEMGIGLTRRFNTRDILEFHPMPKMGISTDENQGLMFVPNIVFMEKHEGRFFGLPSRVRLYGTDDFFRGRRDALYHSAVTGRFEFLSCNADGELGVPPGGLTVVGDKRPKQMVQAGAQVMDNFSSDNTEAYRQWAAICSIDILRRPILMLTDNSIVRCRPLIEGSDVVCEFVDVLFGPLNLS